MASRCGDDSCDVTIHVYIVYFSVIKFTLVHVIHANDYMQIGDQILEVNGLSFLNIVHVDAARALRLVL